MTLLPRSSIKALMLGILVITACSTGTSNQAGPPLAGCKSGTSLVTFWTSHTPPDSDSLKRIVDAYKDRKSTRLNSSHANISYAVFCLKKKNTQPTTILTHPLPQA